MAMIRVTPYMHTLHHMSLFIPRKILHNYAIYIPRCWKKMTMQRDNFSKHPISWMQQEMTRKLAPLSHEREKQKYNKKKDDF